MKRALKLAASLAVTLAFGGWAFRDTDWHQMWVSLERAHYIWLLPYFGILTAIHLVRTIRWGYLLAGIEKVRFWPLNEAAGIGFMMLIVLPFRLGELARPFLVSQRSHIRKSAAMTTVVVERIADALVIATLLRGLLFFVPGNSPELRLVRLGADLTFLVFGGGLVFLLFALWQRPRAVALVRGTLGRLWPSGSDKAAQVVDTFVGAMRQLPSWPYRVGFFVLTFVYWGLNGCGMYLVAKAFPALGLTPFECYLLMCVLVVGVMIPAAPGMAGTFQAALKLGLTLFLPAAVVNASGLAWANVLWLCQTGQQILFGLLFMAFTPLSFRALARKLGTEGATAPLPATAGPHPPNAR